jgi:hypothetical protein
LLSFASLSQPTLREREKEKKGNEPLAHNVSRAQVGKSRSSQKQWKIETTAFRFFRLVPLTGKIQPPKPTLPHAIRKEDKNARKPTKKTKTENRISFADSVNAKRSITATKQQQPPPNNNGVLTTLCNANPLFAPLALPPQTVVILVLCPFQRLPAHSSYSAWGARSWDLDETQPINPRHVHS